MPIQTIPERKAAAARRQAEAVSVLLPRLAARARAGGGRYLLFGSAARGTMRDGSDVDLLLDFPDHGSSRAAWDYAEAACAELGLVPDIRPREWCSERFLAHILPEATVLG